MNSTPEAIERDAGKLGTLLIQTLDKTMSWQSSAITGYVSSLHKRKKDETPAQVQERIDSHYLNLVTGTGGAAGGSAVLPGVGMITGLAAVTGESLLFLEASAWYTLASATLRNIDITDPQRRRTLILAAMSGSEGTAIMASLLGEESLRKQTKTSVNSLLPRLGVPQLGAANRLLIREARKRLMKNARLAIIGKILPFGIGAVVGASANRKLGGILISSTRASLGPLPQDWSDFERKLPAKSNTSEDSKKDSKSSRFSIPSALKWPKKKKNK
ncbi:MULTISPECIES: hypothetical protein [Corynebacterium]|uniref:EcsC family protein n=1 Tax=Corynebacterium amycolatum TaxID=43765 RepID=A0AB38XSU9_CORAY|nr:MULTISPECIES: hypothetical protein [Corynebacterium]MCG7244330.1 hypothetical protein [Corynebacterium sp. ACRPX]MCG7268846.1 hypothetical protein [Corynebacterium amycolatum]MCT1718079.1 hypothetical protein [Corynebacterium amycolatum]MDC7115967.1 hypothetical protein [Corynebacterium amycolatum]MDK6475779.1 hypothetical protein [Corynebacterium amycolatum]